MIKLSSEAECLAFGARIAAVLRKGDIVALSGELGAGKTTLARGILAGLGHVGDVPSPTFTLVQCYDPPDVLLPVWHCDLYRLRDAWELDELGLDEVLEGGVLIVEWPERMGTRLWPETLLLTLDSEGDDVRSLTARVPPAWEGRWPPR